MKDFRIAQAIPKDGVIAMADMITLAPDPSGGHIPVENIVNYLNFRQGNLLFQIAPGVLIRKYKNHFLPASDTISRCHR